MENMIFTLNIIQNFGSFQFAKDSILADVCNIPADIAGIYLIHSVTSNKKKFVYIGSSGSIQTDGSLKLRKGGLRKRITDGDQFDERRRISWPKKMLKNNIDYLEIEWFETYSEKNKFAPVFAESYLLQKFLNENGKLPDWNKKL